MFCEIRELRGLDMEKSVLKNVKLFLFDMDGTLYLGDRLFDFTNELLETIKANGGRYMFMTNNSSKSVKDYILKLEKLGIKADYEDFITSSQATVFYLKNHHPDAKLYVCGTQSLKDEFIKEGFNLTENTDDTEWALIPSLTLKNCTIFLLCFAPVTYLTLLPIPIMFVLPNLAVSPIAAVFAI